MEWFDQNNNNKNQNINGNSLSPYRKMYLRRTFERDQYWIDGRQCPLLQVLKYIDALPPITPKLDKNIRYHMNESIYRCLSHPDEYHIAKRFLIAYMIDGTQSWWNNEENRGVLKNIPFVMSKPYYFSPLFFYILLLLLFVKALSFFLGFFPTNMIQCESFFYLFFFF